MIDMTNRDHALLIYNLVLRPSVGILVFLSAIRVAKVLAS